VAGKELQLHRQREAARPAQTKSAGKGTWWNHFLRIECFPSRNSLKTTFQSFELAQVDLLARMFV